MIVLNFFFQHVFDAATTQGPWKQAPTTTVTTNRSGGNYPQAQQSLSTIPINAGRQKPTVR
jgi:hypothetical protein